MKIIWILLPLIAACNNVSPPKPSTVSNEDGQIFATGLVKPEKRQFGTLHWRVRSERTIPDNFDWSDQGFTTPVRDQGDCGSCWAFGGTQSLELAYKIFDHKAIDFSEQQLVGDLYYGCNGGYFVYDYQEKNGQTDEASCPYRAMDYQCKKGLPVAGKAVTGGMVGQPNRTPTVEEMQSTIQNYGAVATTVYANNSFARYKGGLGSCGAKGSTNHIVALTGWKTVKGKVYFHLKNSWGEKWGEKGYGWFELGCYNLGEEASWVAIEKAPCQPIHVKLPKEVILPYGDSVRLSVKPEDGVAYSWWVVEENVGKGPVLDWLAKENTEITLKAKNICGDAEIKTQITVKP